MGNYVIAGVGNYVIVNPSNLGNYVIADIVGQAFSLVTGLQPWDCKSIAKASKVRILHLPPRAQRVPDQRKRRSGALFLYLTGVSKTARFGGHQVLGPQACDLRKRLSGVGRRRGLWGMRGEVGVHAIVLAGLPAR
jgi:hypothetical protein